MNKRIFTRTIWILSIVSLLTDISSEMLYPIMPIYLKSIGFSVLLIGMLEGLAEATAGLSKGYFGKMSDTMGKRVPFVRLGYLLSAVSKPLMGMFIYPLWIFIARSIDRLGKGIRTSARDAILSEESTPENKGKVFGFHRSMDTFGAVLGPLFAIVFLNYFPEQYRMLFFIAFIPALIGVLFTFVLKERKRESQIKTRKLNFFSFLSYWKISTPQYKKLIIGLLAFSLLNSSDIFLILMVKNLGYGDDTVIVLYILYNLVFALSSFPIGIIADRIGLKNNFILGLLIFAFVYGTMSQNPGFEFIVCLFAGYGIFAASTEGISKAWITNIAEEKNTATALGFYNALNSLCLLIASSLAGWLWYFYNPQVMFSFSSIGTVFVAIYFVMIFRKKKSYI